VITFAFQISSLAKLDFEKTPETGILLKIRASDDGSLYVDKVIIIRLTNLNEPPNGLTISSNTVCRCTLNHLLTHSTIDLHNQYTYHTCIFSKTKVWVVIF
jgi:hypothetical protein